MGGERNIRLKFTGDVSQLDGVSAKGQAQIGKWQRGWEKFNHVAVPAAAAVGLAAVKLGKDSLMLSRRMADLDQKSRTVFEGQLGKVSAWAAQNRKAFGTSRREVIGLATNMADLLKPMGFTSRQAADMSIEMLDLSGALAKWSAGKKTAAEVSEILTKAMLGERDELKSLGISISEADVQARLAAKGQEELTGAALQQAEAIATQELILAKSTDAQKAWANGGKEAATQQNAMASSIQTLREKLATVLGPVLQAVTTFLSDMAGWVDRNHDLALTLGAVLVGLAGFVAVANAAVKLYTAVTKTASAAQWLLTRATGASSVATTANTVTKRASTVATATNTTASNLNAAATARGRVATLAATVATKAMSAAQAVLNAVMRANPLARVIALVTAIGAALVVAWNKSATFRRIATGAFRAVSDAVGWVIDKVATLIGWVKDAIDWLGNLFSMNGSIPDMVAEVKAKAGRRASGGPVHAGRTYLVGERGPELVTMGGNGHVTPNHQLGGPQVLEAHIHIGDEVVRVVRTEIRGHDRGLRRRAMAGAVA